jgi:Cof subfamily protein (haloacid dehalogenase superfamily)
MIRLLALDLDGTLLDAALTISPAVLSAVARAQAHGVHVTIVTGRMFGATLPYARRLNVTGPVVCYQGGAVYDVESGAALYAQPVPNSVAMRVYERAKSDGFHVQMYKDDRYYVEENNAYAAFYAHLTGIEPLVVPSLAHAFAGQSSLKVNMNATPERIAAYEPVIRELVGREGHVSRSLPDFLEVAGPGSDKGSALRFLVDRLGIPLEQTLAVGDSYNDVSFLKTAGIGVAMGSAPPELRVVADAMVGDWRADGVAEAIERFIFAQERV